MSDVFKRDLEQLLNRYCQENASNTPDFVLAQYLSDSLHAFNCALAARRDWYAKPAISQAAGAPLGTATSVGDQNNAGVATGSHESPSSERESQGNLPPLDKAFLPEPLCHCACHRGQDVRHFVACCNPPLGASRETVTPLAEQLLVLATKDGEARDAARYREVLASVKARGFECCADLIEAYDRAVLAAAALADKAGA